MISKLWFLLPVVMLTACATQQPAEFAGKVRMNEADVLLTSVNESIAPGGVMQVAVSAVSTSIYEKSMHYRFVWYDEHHAAINSTTSAWVNRTLQPKEPFDFVATAPSRHAVSYQIDMENQ